MKKFVIYIIALLAAVGCSQTNEVAEALNRADSIMETRQDDAIKSLAMLDSLKPQLDGMTQAQRMRFHLLQAKAMNKGYVEFTSDSIMLGVVDYYDHHGSSYEKQTANYLLGCVYRDLGDAPTAMKYLERATDHAKNDVKSYKLLAHIHNQMANLLDEQALVESEIRELDIAKDYALLAGDTVDAVATFSQMAIAYSLVNKMDSVKIITDSCISMFNKLGLHQYAAHAYYYDINCYIQDGNFSKAHERIATFEAESGLF